MVIQSKTIGRRYSQDTQRGRAIHSGLSGRQRFSTIHLCPEPQVWDWINTEHAGMQTKTNNIIKTYFNKVSSSKLEFKMSLSQFFCHQSLVWIVKTKRLGVGLNSLLWVYSFEIFCLFLFFKEENKRLQETQIINLVQMYFAKKKSQLHLFTSVWLMLDDKQAE